MSRTLFSGLALTLLIAAGCSSSGGPTITLKASGSSTAAVTSASEKVPITYVSPSSLKAKIYEFWVSDDPLCTNPTLVFSDDAAAYSDVITEPTIGTGSAANGTYPCLIMVFDDTIKYTPESGITTHCVAETEYSGGTCHDGESTLLPDGGDGTETDCTDGEDKVAYYFSTAVASDIGGGAGFHPPDDPDSPTMGAVLDGALVVDGDTTSTMFIDATNKIWENGGNCEMSEADFGFR